MTPNLNLVFLDVGQKEKEVTINTNMGLIDTAVKANQDAIATKAVALADAASPPATTGLIPGSTYYNTTDNKVYWLRPNLSWVALT